MIEKENLPASLDKVPWGNNKNLEDYPVFLFFLIAGLTLLFRFYHLTALSSWPRFDESLLSRAAVDLSENWNWKLRLTSWQIFPLYIWMEALLFKAFGPSLFLIWSFSAALGTLTVGVGYLAARQFFPQGTAILGTLLLAGSFWPAFISRFPQNSSLTLLFEMLVFLAMGLLWNTKKNKPRLGYAALLGLITGMGIYTYIAFFAVVPLVLGAVAYRFARRPNRNYFVLASFGGIGILATTPMVLDLIRHGAGNYIQSLSIIGNTMTANQLLVALSYFSSIFGVCLQKGDYQPIWGAFLSPILAIFFLIGLIRIFKTWKQPVSRWILLSLLVSMVPAILTKTSEYLRIAIAIPFVFMICMLGTSWLLEVTTAQRRLWIYGLIALSVAWDGYRLLIEYPKEWATPSARWADNIKSIRSWRAFGILSHEAENLGPGCYLGNLITKVLDQSLATAAYSFNTAANPKYGFDDSHWVAAITNLHYKPFLQARFPEARVYNLDLEGVEPYGGDILFLAPITAGNRNVFAAWFEMDQRLKAVTTLIVDRSESGPRTQILEELAKRSPFTRDDPFLESCLWEEIYTQLNYEIAWGEVKPQDNIVERVNVLRQALKKGYPVAHLWNELGNLYWLTGNIPQARLAFEEAIRAPLNKTKAREHLRLLDASIKSTNSEKSVNQK